MKEWLLKRMNKRVFCLGALAVLFLAVLSYGVYWITTPDTLNTVDTSTKAGEEIVKDLQSSAALPFVENDDVFVIEDVKNDGIDIQYANSKEGDQEKQEEKFTVSFPKDYAEAIEIKLDESRVIKMKDVNGKGYDADVLTGVLPNTEKNSLFSRLFPEEGPSSYLRYESGRKTLLYSYQKDTATGERVLKHWTLYENGSGKEQESYQFENAKLKVNDVGDVELFYFGAEDIKSQEAAAQVPADLMARAQKTIQKDLGADIFNGKRPDLTLPKPYYYDKDGNYHETDWKLEGETLFLEFEVAKDMYPVALDPTLSFIAPGTSNSGSVIMGEAANSSFGTALATGDLNSDGKVDLVVGASSYSSSTGRVYIFYNDGGMVTWAAGADVTITGETTSNFFGTALATGDLNSDGKVDLIVGANGYSSLTGRAYIFHNDGSIPTTAGTADVTITGETTSNLFGTALATGDLNTDGTVDLVVGAYGYSSSTGRAYIFHNDGSIPTTAGTADVTITGETTGNNFSYSLVTGDLNSDGRTDLLVGAYGYSTSTGRAYIFHNDGSIPTTAATADVTITGGATSNSFGIALTTGDFDASGTIDLVVGASTYTTSTGRAYIFHNDGSIPTTAGTADVTITGETTSNQFGVFLTTGDLNSDGKVDLVVGALQYSTSTGRVYVFYNDGSIPTTAATADVVITGEALGNNFGSAIATGDLNADGRTDLIAGAYAHASSTGRAYIFYSQNGQVSTNQYIEGETTSNQFGFTMTTGDLNTDGRTDLVVAANTYNSSQGRVYIFYNDGSYVTAAGSADVIITGNATGDDFGVALAIGDLNADGRADLVVGAETYSTNTGRAYIFYNDGSIPTTAGTADITITGSSNHRFGSSFAMGDLNADGRPDLLVGAIHSTTNGTVSVFYNDGSIPTTSGTADLTITGEASANHFGVSFAFNDMNADGIPDLVVGGRAYSTSTGRVYVFYNDGSITSAAGSADIIITGEETTNSFGGALATVDLNADGVQDLVVGARGHASTRGRVYVFYNDGSIVSDAASADIIIAGELFNNGFGDALAVADFNADGRTDLAIGAGGYSTNTGRAYIFYSDGSIPADAINADVIITGDTTTNNLGTTLAAGDFNADGRIDLAVGAYTYSTSTGRVYIYETRENFSWEIQGQDGTPRISPAGSGQEIRITGEAGSDFGVAMTVGDMNGDGKTDLIVGASAYSTSTGRVYIFYNNGSYPAAVPSADVTITGEATISNFGSTLITGDFNADGTTDLVVGAQVGDPPSLGNAGKVFLFYNDGSIPTTAGTADVTISGVTINGNFGRGFAAGDFNADARTDLVVSTASTTTGVNNYIRIFYNDGSYPSLETSADITIDGEAVNNGFGHTMVTGDFNSDGRLDLAAGAYRYSSNTGRVYIFHNDGSIPTTGATADVIIDGSTAFAQFGFAITAGDLNADGRTDLAVGTNSHSTNTGRAYIFHNDGSIPTTAATADVTITGETTSNFFGTALATGDFNADGRSDLVVSATGYSSSTGRAYIFHNDGSIPTTAATADITLTGEVTSNQFGISLTTGDLNADGKADLAVGAHTYNSSQGRTYIYTFNDTVATGESASEFGWSMAAGDLNSDGRMDLVVGAPSYSTDTGRAYIFYNDGSLAATAATADVTITGNATGDNFGSSLATGDLNADGRIDLAVGANTYSSDTGRAYIFHNDGSIPTTAGTADVTITGNATGDEFGSTLATGDLNADGKTDLAVGAYGYSSSTGRAYIFHNDGSVPTTAGTADVTITGNTAGDGFGTALATGDLNADGTTDLAAGADQFSTGAGRAYIFHNDGSIPTTAGTADVTITGNAADDSFGYSLITGDLNADGRIDLAVGAPTYNSGGVSHAYIFHNDGSIPTTAGTADVTITSETTNNAFGGAVAAADLNADGKTDFIVGAEAYSSGTGRTYIFHNDGAYPSGAASADLIQTGQSSGDGFGWAFATADFNTDSKIDLAVGAPNVSSSAGAAYIILTEVRASDAAITNAANLKGTMNLKGSATFR